VLKVNQEVSLGSESSEEAPLSPVKLHYIFDWVKVEILVGHTAYAASVAMSEC
jgi:hypothetical protein